MKIVCKERMCTGCKACVAICPQNAINIQDHIEYFNAIIDSDRCVECGICYHVCQVNIPLKLNVPQKWFQGWSRDEKVRLLSSSGGAATAISQAFVKCGGVVCSCCFREGRFVFEIAETKEELHKFVGSKYVKSDTGNIYQEIKKRLKAQIKVLFIGLPCQVAGLKRYIGKEDTKKLYTIDLICHGTPSSEILRRFFCQHGYDIKEFFNISFRVKQDFRLSGNEFHITESGVKDAYLIGFTEGLFYTENCYSCSYAQTNRVSDLTLGDAWGSNLSEKEQKRGISLLISQNERGLELINMADIYVEDIDPEQAIRNNNQLERPSKMTKKRWWFTEQMKADKKIDEIIARLYPKQWIKQILKTCWIKIEGQYYDKRQ